MALVGQTLDRDWERMVAFYSRNSTGSISARRTRSSRRSRPCGYGQRRPSGKKVANATAGIWHTLLILKRTFRKLDAPELLVDVAEGVAYADPSQATHQDHADEKAAA